VNVTIQVDNEAQDLLAVLAEGFGPTGLAEANEAGGRGAVVAAREFHREFDAAGGWRGPRTTGSGKSEFGSNVAMGWFFTQADATGATISNDADHLAFKVTGGTITPKRVSYLTIPLIPEAKGRRAKNYEIDNNTRLFVVRGKKALFEKRPDGGIRAVYALLASVTQRPWPDAIPPDDILGDAFVGGVNEWLEGLLETA